MVRIERLGYYYNRESPIFLDFDWNINRGERWAVIGPSGCGKTTLLYLLAGLRMPAAGKISIDDGHVDGHKPLTGLILQDYGLLPWATARENVSLGLRIRGADKRKTREITRQWLCELGIENVAGHYPSELSGGQRQRVAIARTMAIAPSLLLMDEPFSSLDAFTREELLNLVLNLWENLAFTMVLVTHNIEEAVFSGQKIMVLGAAPNTRPVIVENALSGSSGYRNSLDFVTRCKELRELMEQNSRGKDTDKFE